MKKNEEEKRNDNFYKKCWKDKATTSTVNIATITTSHFNPYDYIKIQIWIFYFLDPMSWLTSLGN